MRLFALAVAFVACSPAPARAPAPAPVRAPAPVASEAPSAAPPPAPPAKATGMSPQAELKAEEMLPIVLRQQDRSVRVKTAAELLYETESGRIPKPALVALFVAGAPETADKRTRILFEALDDPALAPVWQRVCTASGEARTAMSRFEAPPRETTAKVYRSCGWAQSGLAVPAGELGEQFRMIVLGHLLLPYLEAQGGIADVERQLLRILIRGGRLPEPPFQAAELR